MDKERVLELRRTRELERNECRSVQREDDVAESGQHRRENASPAPEIIALRLASSPVPGSVLGFAPNKHSRCKSYEYLYN